MKQEKAEQAPEEEFVDVGDDWGEGDSSDGWGDEDLGSDDEPEAQPTNGGMKKQQSTLSEGESAFVRIFNMEQLKTKFFKREIAQYDEILFTNEDETIAICRYFDWNKEKVQNQWMDNQDKLRLEIGLDYDESLVKQHPNINQSRKENNQGYCAVMACEFDESDPEMVPKSLKCGH